MKQRIRNYEIESIDDNNYTVNRVGISDGEKTRGQETLSLVGYFNSVESAIRRVAELCGNTAPDLNGWLREYRTVIEEVKETLK